MKALLSLLVFITSSCTFASKDFTVALGGKGAAKGAQYATTWDNERSFQDGSMLAGVAIAAAQAVKQTVQTETTARVIHTNNTKLGIVQSNNATKEVLGAQAADVTKATTLPK